MAVQFTVYTWYEKGNRIQKNNFIRLNRSLKKKEETFELIVFYFDEGAPAQLQKFENIRYWRLHKDMMQSPTVLMSEAFRNSRSNVLVYVSPDVLARKTDLYRLANFVAMDNTMAWLDSKKGSLHSKKNMFLYYLKKIQWLFTMGRVLWYSHINSPFDFFKASFFSVNKERVNHIFSGLTPDEKASLLKNDQPGTGYLNYYFFHLLNKNAATIINGGKSGSFDFNFTVPPFFYTYVDTFRLVKLMFKTGHFYFRISSYRFLLPVMQLTQIIFFVLVWFYPWRSLNLIAFYLMLSSSIVVTIFLKKRQWSMLLIFVWFFSWLVA